MDFERTQTEKVSEGEMQKKLSSLGKDFQTEMVNLIASYNSKINKEMIDLADEVGDLQEKLSATTETCNQLFVTVNELKDENENLRNKLGAVNTPTGPQNPVRDTEEGVTDFQDVLLQISDEDGDSEESDDEEGMMSSVQVNCDSDYHEERVDIYDPTTQKHKKAIEEDANENGNVTQSETLTQREPEGRTLINPNTSEDENRIRLKNNISNSRICPKCDLSFSKKSSVRRHIRTVHNKIKDHICEDCGHAFTDKRHLKSHTINVHNNGGPTLKCMKCAYETGLKKHLDQHVQGVHDKIRDHKCKQCGYAASMRHHLESHVRAVHDQIRGHICKLCGYAASQKAHLTRHIRSVHNKIKDHICEDCGHAFADKRSLRSHRINFHNYRDEI